MKFFTAIGFLILYGSSLQALDLCGLLLGADMDSVPGWQRVIRPTVRALGFDMGIPSLVPGRRPVSNVFSFTSGEISEISGTMDDLRTRDLFWLADESFLANLGQLSNLIRAIQNGTSLDLSYPSAEILNDRLARQSHPATATCQLAFIALFEIADRSVAEIYFGKFPNGRRAFELRLAEPERNLTMIKSLVQTLGPPLPLAQTIRVFGGPAPEKIMQLKVRHYEEFLRVTLQRLGVENVQSKLLDIRDFHIERFRHVAVYKSFLFHFFMVRKDFKNRFTDSVLTELIRNNGIQSMDDLKKVFLTLPGKVGEKNAALAEFIQWGLHGYPIRSHDASGVTSQDNVDVNFFIRLSGGLDLSFKSRWGFQYRIQRDGTVEVYDSNVFPNYQGLPEKAIPLCGLRRPRSFSIEIFSNGNLSHGQIEYARSAIEDVIARDPRRYDAVLPK